MKIKVMTKLAEQVNDMLKKLLTKKKDKTLLNLFSFALGILVGGICCYLFLIFLESGKEIRDWISKNSSLVSSFVFGLVITLTIVICTRKIYKVREKQIEAEHELCKNKIVSLSRENVLKIKVAKKIDKTVINVSHNIANALIANPFWLDRFMDEIGGTFSASVFGKRFRHFYYEKKAIAKCAVKKIDDMVFENKDKKYCLIIESGTTMFSLFPEITQVLKDKEKQKKWENQICIVTNNIPGSQYLMKNCKEDPLDDHSEMTVNCVLMPGTVNSELAATECNKPENWLKDLGSDIYSKNGEEYKIIGFLTGHHIVYDQKHNEFCPVTSKPNYIRVKNQIAERSDEIFLIAPLMQFLFASDNELNELYKKVCQRKGKKHVDYDIIKNISADKTTVFTSNRNKSNYLFHEFSIKLFTKLNEVYKYVQEVDFDLKTHIQTNSPRDQISLEIPDGDLRYLYEKEEINFWDVNKV